MSFTWVYLAIGLCLGSFINVLVEYLVGNRTTLRGYSHCDHCLKNLKIIDLIPVVSFILSSGKSRCCGKKLSWQYPIVELATGLIFVLIGMNHSLILDLIIKINGFLPSPMGLNSDLVLISESRFKLREFLTIVALLSLGFALITMFIADFRYYILPDFCQLLFLISTMIIKILTYQDVFVVLKSFGLAIVFILPILTFYWFDQGRVLGFGDVKLFFNIALLLGLYGALLSLYFATVFGSVIGIILILSKNKQFKSRIAFGPFIIAGMTVLFVLHKFLSIYIEYLFDL